MAFKDLFAKNYYVTSDRDPDPFFRPRRYGKRQEEVLAVVRSIIEKLPGWKIVNYYEIQGRLQVGRRGFLGLGEAVDFYIIRGQDGITTLEVTSRSRVGKGDWGRNKKNLKTFLSELDRMLPGEKVS
jgi:uncharacterized protein (DUF1499 family)